jgi:succinoglycan biosynthesis protein ExoA
MLQGQIIVDEDLPFVSIVMPVYNEAGFISRSLEAVLTQDYPHDRLEVLIADGLSQDGTREVIAELVTRHPDIAVRVIDNPGRIVSTGLNAAVAQAKGEVIIRVDGHCEVAPDFVHENIRILADHPEAWSVGGPIIHRADSPTGRAIAVAMSHWLGVGNACHRFSRYEGFVEGTAFPAIRRWVFDKIGNFDEKLVRNQDDEFNYRINQAGGKIYISPRVRYIYYVRDSISKVFKQYFQYGFWRLPVIRKHRRPTTLRQIVPSLFYLAVLLLLLIGLAQNQWKLALALPSIYLTSLILFGVIFIPKLELNAALRLPLIIAAMHAGYAWGFLYGMWASIFKPGAWDRQGPMAGISR